MIILQRSKKTLNQILMPDDKLHSKIEASKRPK